MFSPTSAAKSQTMDAEINCRIMKASASFGKLRSRVWSNHDLKLNTKVEVYNIVVLSTLLRCGLYQRHIKKLKAFHQRCLRAICGIKWQDLVSDLEVLQRCKTISIETNIRHRQLRWCGHIARMSDQRLAKQLLYEELKTGKRPQGRPRKRYKDEVRVSLSKFRLPDLREAAERSRWRTLLHQGSRIAENDR